MEANWEIFETADEQEETKPHTQTSAPESPGASSDIDLEEPPKPEKAFEVFCGRRYLPSTDLSDTIHKPRNEIPLLSTREAPHTLESPYERYNRLRSEIDHLRNDLSLADYEPDSEAKDGDHMQSSSSDYHRLAQAVKDLHGSLDVLRHAKALQSGDELRMESRQDVKRLLQSHLDATDIPRQNSDARRIEGEKKGSAGIKYELFYSRSKAETLETENFQALEQRLHQLEQVVGAEKPPDSTAKSIGERLRSMETRVNCLDANALEAAARKAKSLNGELDALQRLQRKTSKFPLADGSAFAVEQVSAMFKKLERCDAVAAMLDPLLERLEVLAQVHSGNARHQNRVTALEQGQEQLRELLNKDRQLLEEMKESMKGNMKIIEQNLSELK